MSDPRYDILFGGELLPGFAPGTVADNLAKLFKATPETVQKLMGGGTHALKRNTDRDTALKYQAAMQRAGAKAIVREVGEADAAVPPAAAAAPAAPAASAAPAAPPAPVAEAAAVARARAESLSLAPQAGDILAEHEKRVIESATIDTSHIKLVSTFMAPEAPPAAPAPPAPDTRHLSVAEVGADLLTGRSDEPPPPPPDTSALSLAEPGATLGPDSPQPLVAVPDVSAITLAPPGAPLEELRPERKPLNPDTSALQLEPAPR